jgi:hypothetical protein
MPGRYSRDVDLGTAPARQLLRCLLPWGVINMSHDLHFWELALKLAVALFAGSWAVLLLPLLRLREQAQIAMYNKDAL